MLFLTTFPCNTRSERVQAGYANDAFFKENIEEAVKLMSSLMTSEAHGEDFCSEGMYFFKNGFVGKRRR